MASALLRKGSYIHFGLQEVFQIDPQQVFTGLDDFNIDRRWGVVRNSLNWGQLGSIRAPLGRL